MTAPPSTTRSAEPISAAANGFGSPAKGMRPSTSEQSASDNAAHSASRDTAARGTTGPDANT